MDYQTAMLLCETIEIIAKVALVLIIGFGMGYLDRMETEMKELKKERA